jgi:hypothetical protein
MLQEIGISGKTNIEWQLLMPVLATLVHQVGSSVPDLMACPLSILISRCRTPTIFIIGMDLLDRCLNHSPEDMRRSSPSLNPIPILRGHCNALLSCSSILVGSIHRRTSS